MGPEDTFANSFGATVAGINNNPAAPDVNFDPTQPIPLYPSSRYVDPDKPLAPEKTLTYNDVAGIAAARKIAEKNGVLTPELGEHLLPMAMVEGRGGNFGVKTDNQFYAKPSTVKRFKDMGLNVVDFTDPAVQAAHKYDSTGIGPDGKTQFYKHVGMTNDPNNPGGPLVPVKVPFVAPPDPDMVISKGKSGEKFISPNDTGEGVFAKQDPFIRARMMAAILGEKAAIDTSKTAEGAVKLYNGRGKATEVADGVTTPADVGKYWDKVRDAKGMIAHPKNKPLLNYFQSVYSK